jgi:hypothetical protein
MAPIVSLREVVEALDLPVATKRLHRHAGGAVEGLEGPSVTLCRVQTMRLLQSRAPSVSIDTRIYQMFLKSKPCLHSFRLTIPIGALGRSSKDRTCLSHLGRSTVSVRG